MGIIDSGTTPLQIKKESDCWKDFRGCLWKASGLPGIFEALMGFLVWIAGKLPGVDPKFTVNSGQDFLAGGSASYLMANLVTFIKLFTKFAAKIVGWVGAVILAYNVSLCIIDVIVCIRDVRKNSKK